MRGAAVSDNLTLQTASGLLEGQVRLTCIEAPGIYEDGIDSANIAELDRHLRSIGFLTHILVVWDALEWRLEDLDFVLASLRKIFGVHIGLHLVFAVTFWDQDRKGRKERKKRKITYESVSRMIRDRMEAVFGLPEEPLVYFLSAKSASDLSGQYLADFLASKSWAPFRVDHMKGWLEQLGHPGDHKAAGQTETDGHDYEDVGRYSADRYEADSVKAMSKSLHNLAVENTPPRNLDQTRGQAVGGSMFTLGKAASSPAKGQVRGRPRGGLRSNLFGQRKSSSPAPRSFSEAQRSQSHGNLLMQNKKGKGASTMALAHQKSIENVYDVQDSSGGLFIDNTYRENSVCVDSDIDAIEKDPEFQPDPVVPAASRGQQKRQRLVSTGSSTFSGFGRAKGRAKKEGQHNQRPHESRPRSRSRSKSKSRSRSRSDSRSMSGSEKVDRYHLSKTPSEMSVNDGERSSLGRGRKLQQGRSFGSLGGSTTPKGRSQNNINNIGGARQPRIRTLSATSMGSMGGSRQAKSGSQTRVSLSGLGGSRQARPRSQSRTSLSSIGGSRQARPASLSKTSLSSIGGSRQSRARSQSRTSLGSIGGSRQVRPPTAQSKTSLVSIGGSRQARPRSQSRTSFGSIGDSRQARPRSQSRTRSGDLGGSLEAQGRATARPASRPQTRGRSGSRPGRGQAEACSVM